MYHVTFLRPTEARAAARPRIHLAIIILCMAELRIEVAGISAATTQDLNE